MSRSASRPGRCHARADSYPARSEHGPRTVPRIDPVVHAPPSRWFELGLHKGAIERFAQDGFAVLPGFYSQRRVELLRRAAERITVRAARGWQPSVREPGGQVRHVLDLQAASPSFDEVARDPELVGLAKDLLWSDVYVHQMRLTLKPPLVGREHYWHSDFEAWHFDGMPRMRALSCMILLEEHRQESGPLLVMPASHLEFVCRAGPQRSSDDTSVFIEPGRVAPDVEILTRWARRHGVVGVTGQPGDLCLLDCNIMQGSTANITPFGQRDLVVCYNSVENTDARVGLAGMA